MTGDTKLLQTVLDKVSSLDKKVDVGFSEVGQQFKETNKRIDKIGLQVARLEDDAPTVGEFGDLKKEVVKIKHHLALNC